MPASASVSPQLDSQTTGVLLIDSMRCMLHHRRLEKDTLLITCHISWFAMLGPFSADKAWFTLDALGSHELERAIILRCCVAKLHTQLGHLTVCLMHHASSDFRIGDARSFS